MISAKNQHRTEGANGAAGSDGTASGGVDPAGGGAIADRVEDDRNPQGGLPSDEGPNPDDGTAGQRASVEGAPAVAVTVQLDDAALRLARAAAVDEAGGADLVGDAVDVYAEDAVAVTARFQALLDGYRGWLWSVTIALLDAGHPTVSEVVLLPGPDALTAPAWVPWEQRIRSGDLGVGDLLPPAPDDARLAPAYLQSDDPAIEQVAHELGIGRVRVLSRQGRDDAADRWHDGAFGPHDDMAAHAPGHCVTCAFYLPLAGSLGQGFGACGNEYSPADGRVVDAGYGCGAHSEAISTRRARSATTDTVVDELRLEVHARTAERPAGDGSGADPTIDVSGDGADVDGGADAVGDVAGVVDAVADASDGAGIAGISAGDAADDDAGVRDPAGAGSSADQGQQQE